MQACVCVLAPTVGAAQACGNLGVGFVTASGKGLRGEGQDGGSLALLALFQCPED